MRVTKLSNPSQGCSPKIAQNPLSKTSSPRLYSKKSLKPRFAEPEQSRSTTQSCSERVNGIQPPPTNIRTQAPAPLSSIPREDPQPAPENHHRAAKHSPEHFKRGRKHQPWSPRKGVWPHQSFLQPKGPALAPAEHTPTQAKGF